MSDKERKRCELKSRGKHIGGTGQVGGDGKWDRVVGEMGGWSARWSGSVTQSVPLY